MEKLLQFEPDKTIYFLSNTEGQRGTVKIRSLSSGSVAVKVKTNAPNSVIISPARFVLDSSIDYIVISIKIKSEMVNDTTFLFQFFNLSSDNVGDFTSKEPWQSVSKDVLYEHRLHARFGKPLPDSCDASLDDELTPMTPSAPSDITCCETHNIRQQYSDLVNYAQQLENENKLLKAQSTNKTDEGGSQPRTSAGMYSFFQWCAPQEGCRGGVNQLLRPI